MATAFPVRFPDQLRQHLRALRKRHGLTQAQLGALIGVSQARIAEMIAYDRATIGGVIERLEQKGWVDRVVSERDRRARVLSLTPEGERIIQALVPVVRDLQDEILQSLGDADRARFLRLARQAVGP